jgi:ADP-ribosylglycohydrolase
MAGAMAGATVGERAIPGRLKEICEGVDDAISQADKLHELVTRRMRDKTNNRKD